MASTESGRGSLSLAQLFLVFLKAGFAFGGGLAILAVIEEEFVTRRKLVGRDEFLALYGISRIVPSGTMTALAVAYGHRFGGHLGVVASLAGLVLPGFVSTVALAAAYAELVHGQVLGYLSATLLPAALAVILTAALRLGRAVFRPGLDPLLAVAGLVGAQVFGVSPAILLVAGGLAGAFIFGTSDGARQ